MRLGKELEVWAQHGGAGKSRTPLSRAELEGRLGEVHIERFTKPMVGDDIRDVT